MCRVWKGWVVEGVGSVGDVWAKYSHSVCWESEQGCGTEDIEYRVGNVCVEAGTGQQKLVEQNKCV